MKITKPSVIGFAFLWAVGAYIVHPILFIISIVLVAVATV